jgi:hypothetical protein
LAIWRRRKFGLQKSDLLQNIGFHVDRHRMGVVDHGKTGLERPRRGMVTGAASALPLGA